RRTRRPSESSAGRRAGPGGKASATAFRSQTRRPSLWTNRYRDCPSATPRADAPRVGEAIMSRTRVAEDYEDLRPLLFSIAYRMLAGVAEAEDIVQEAFLRYQRALHESAAIESPMAFLLLLERLSPVERAVFLLHDVFDYGYGEIAEIVGRSEGNCRQLAVRAR